MVKKYGNFDGVYSTNGKLATKNLVPGKRVYDEKLISKKGTEYRTWDKYRSKPAAALKKGISKFPIKSGKTVLYLGAASGTTVSHFSDIVQGDGVIYAVEFSERVLRDLVPHAQTRGNIVTILADARKPDEYSDKIFGKVDVIFEDVASKDQIAILIRNAERFLKPDGYAMIAIKSQSIDVTKNPDEIYKKCLIQLKKHFDIIDKVKLDPYEKMHMFLVMRYKK